MHVRYWCVTSPEVENSHKDNASRNCAGSDFHNMPDKSIVFAKIKTLLTTNMLDKSSGYLFGSTPVGILAFSKIFNQGLSFKVGELTYFLESIKLSLDSSYNLKADLVYKFLALKEKLK